MLCYELTSPVRFDLRNRQAGLKLNSSNGSLQYGLARCGEVGLMVEDVDFGGVTQLPLIKVTAVTTRTHTEFGSLSGFTSYRGTKKAHIEEA